MIQTWNHFTESKKRITLQKDIKILRTLKIININYSSVAKSFNVSPTYVTNLFDRKIDIDLFIDTTPINLEKQN